MRIFIRYFQDFFKTGSVFKEDALFYILDKVFTRLSARSRDTLLKRMTTLGLRVFKHETGTVLMKAQTIYVRDHMINPRVKKLLHEREMTSDLLPSHKSEFLQAIFDLDSDFSRRNIDEVFGELADTMDVFYNGRKRRRADARPTEEHVRVVKPRNRYG